MTSHSDEDLRFRCTEAFLSQFAGLTEHEPPVGDTVQALVDRLGSQLLTFSASSTEAARRDLLFPALLTGLHGLLLRASKDDEPATGERRLALDSEIVQEQQLCHFMTCFGVAIDNKACAASLLQSRHYAVWLDAAAIMQGSVDNIRRENEHVEYASFADADCDHSDTIRYETDEFMFGMYHESWWTAAFTELCAPIGSLVPLTVAALQKVFVPAQARLETWLAHRERARPTVRNASPADLCFADVARATPRLAFTSTRDATSFTLPLHRWLAALIRRASDLRLAPSAIRQLVRGNTTDLLALAVHPMRLQVLLGEVRADMWAKNGLQTMQGQIRHYVGFRTLMLELDLLFLQVRAERCMSSTRT